MPRKVESESSIKYCLGRTVELVQRFTTIQNFGHNWRRADGIRVEYFPGFATLQPVDKVQEFINKMSDPAPFQGRIFSMSMFNDITWRNTDNEQECSANATLVTLFAKRFPAGRWSFLGLGSEKKWYSTCKERPGGEWEKVAELMMIKFGESGHPVFHCFEERSKAKKVENYLFTSVPMGIRLKLFFAQLFLLISSVSTKQSQMCVRNTVLVNQERGDPCWQDNPTHCSSQQNYW